jgi:hypothetical protein
MSKRHGAFALKNSINVEKIIPSRVGLFGTSALDSIRESVLSTELIVR